MAVLAAFFDKADEEDSDTAFNGDAANAARLGQKDRP
jgi:hypothetical protein